MKRTLGILFCILLITASFVSASTSVEYSNNYILQQKTSQNHNNNQNNWQVEYNESLWANKVATDSMDNVIVVGAGGRTTVEFPYAVIVKYTKDGKLIWSDHRTVPIFPSVIPKVNLISNFVYLHTITKSIKQTSEIGKTFIAKQASIFIKTQAGKEASNALDERIKGAHQYTETMFSNAPNPIWGKWVRFYDVAVDNDDNIVVAGEIQNRFTKDLRTSYIIKYDSNGNVLWDKIYKRYFFTPRDLATAVAIDSNNNIFVSIRSQEKDSENYKGWILKLSSEGGAKMYENIHTSTSIIFSDITIDSQDNVYISGYYPMSQDMTVIKYSNNLALLDEWKQSVRPIRPYAINVDPNDNIIVAGGIGFSGNQKQYIVKFNSFGNIVWSYKSKDIGLFYDVATINADITAATGINLGNETYGRFYVGLFNETGAEYKRFLGGNKTDLDCFFSYGLSVDTKGDIAVAGFRWYGTALYYMNTMKFYRQKS